MERIVIRDVEVEGTSIEKLHVILDDEKSVIFLPLLWTTHLANTGTIFGWHQRGHFSSGGSSYAARKPISIEKSFEMRPVSENTIQNYIGHFFQFLKYINDLNKSDEIPTVHHTQLVNSRFINHYLNNVLPEKLQSKASLSAHQAAISAYYSFLHELEIKGPIPSIINRKTEQYMAEKDTRLKKINYVSRAERSALLRACNSERDRLIIRMGFEVGLRSSENMGLVLGEHKAKLMKQKGLLSLFDELDNNPSKHSFEFVLSGKFTKRGKTRNIYYDRELLTAMKRYYDNERLSVVQQSGRSFETLFLRTDNEGAGLSISAEHASNLFNKLIKQLHHANHSLSYHDLRHTFATELYHAELKNPEGQETRSESAALIVVAERLGHSDLKSTRRYIRLRQQMLMIEENL